LCVCLFFVFFTWQSLILSPSAGWSSLNPHTYRSFPSLLTLLFMSGPILPPHLHTHFPFHSGSYVRYI
jgi:hypothetical protein